MKARLEKIENGEQSLSESKQFKNMDDANNLNNEESCLNQDDAIKGEGGNDVLQFPLGVRIKKEVLDPREEGEEGCEDDDDEMDSDNFDGKPRKIRKRQSLGQRPNMVGKVPRQILNKGNTEEDSIELLKKVVSEVADAGQIWKVVRSRILSQCQIWDLLMDKVLFRLLIHILL